MEKLVVPAAAADAVSIDRPLDETLVGLAAALDKPVSALLVAIQDRPRHTELVAAVRRLGAGVVLFGDGDVMTSLRVLMPEGDLDALLGVGGAPEGVITACAARLLGGGMQGRLAPQSPAERTRLEAAGISVGDVVTLADLVADDDCVFVATGVTGGTLLGRPQPIGTGWRTFSLLATAGHPRLLVESLTG
jgi:fructose-1,6-bisphosphatase II